MAIVGLVPGQLKFLRTFLAQGTYFLALFKNDRRPAAGDSLQHYVEADFSGYQGPQPIANWTEPTMVDGRAFSKADTLTWLHSGAEVENLIYGYFVTDDTGELMWAERNPAGPRIVSASSPDYVVEPVLTETSEF